MKAKFSEKANFSVFELEDKDIKDAQAISNMMKCEGWKRLMEYYAVSRETVIDRLKQLPRTDVEVRRTALIGAVLHGLDEAIAIPSRVVSRAQEYIEQREEERKDANMEVNSNDE